MVEGRGAPTAGRTVVGGGDNDGAGKAPLWVIYTFNLETSTAA